MKQCSIFKTGIIVAVGVTMMLSSVAMADSVKVSGFASAVVGKASGDPFSGSNYYEKDGKNDISFHPDSLAGLQFSSKLSNELSATVQIVAKSKDRDSTVHLEWAYMNYVINDETVLQMGRFRPAVYLYSSTLDVAYSYLWISTPTELYAQIPMSYTDGINLMYDYTFENDMSLSASAYYSAVHDFLVDSTGNLMDFDFTSLYGAEVNLSNDDFKFRLGYLGLTFDAITGNPTVDTTPGLVSADSTATFVSAGFTMDWNNIIILSEYAVRNVVDTLFTEDTDSYYVTLGYRFGKFTPHITYSNLDAQPKPSSDGTVKLYREEQANDSTTITAGIRYDLNPKSAIKFEYSNIDRKPESTNPDTSTNLVRLALNVAF